MKLYQDIQDKWRSLTWRNVKPRITARELLKPANFSIVDHKMIISHVVELGSAASEEKFVCSINLC